MTMFTCEQCERILNDGYHPQHEHDGETVCDDCYEDMVEEERLADQKLQDHKDSMEAAAEDFNDDKRRGL